MLEVALFRIVLGEIVVYAFLIGAVRAGVFRSYGIGASAFGSLRTVDN